MRFLRPSPPACQLPLLMGLLFIAAGGRFGTNEVSVELAQRTTSNPSSTCSSTILTSFAITRTCLRTWNKCRTCSISSVTTVS